MEVDNFTGADALKKMTVFALTVALDEGAIVTPSGLNYENGGPNRSVRDGQRPENHREEDGG